MNTLVASVVITVVLECMCPWDCTGCKSCSVPAMCCAAFKCSGETMKCERLAVVVGRQ